ncbi:DUF2586 family protein [Epilithonimonas mollis]|uniref:DUF2586 family protein n=1 Tax=Epilithonimonas mollis TaxID=216903 RepID=A0A1M6UKI3_9FLAO|nr:DUF2586 family protein [Epilithonimonas mollis]SHK69701.1 hypothetical protein SAMN05444371_3352 [Epilithonimonas mollis]
MSNLNGVNIKRGKVGANRLGSDDAISGIIITSPEVANLEFDVPVTVYNISDVEDLGITKDFDKNQNVNVYEHLSEFYRLAGNGTELHALVAEQDQKMVDLLDAPAKKLLIAAGGKIKQLGIAVNLESTATITLLNGFPDDVYNAIAAAKALEEWSEENFMPVTVFIEGHHYAGNAASSADLRDLLNLSAEGVAGLVIGQDYDVAAQRTGHAQKYGNVGTVLGVTASCTVEKNIGENETKNLTSESKKLLINPALSNHVLNSAQYASLQTLEDKGYIFGVTYTGMAGVRLNNDHVCAPKILDDDNNINEHTIAYGRVGKKARRGLRTAYLPKVKTTWLVNETTGKLSPGTVASLEEIGDKVFADMKKRGEITYGKTTVDPASDLIVEKVLKVSYVIVPKGSIGEITGFINIKTQI